MRPSPIFWILATSTILRLINLNQSFWLDESLQALEVIRPLSQQFDIVNDFHPPLFHLVAYVFALASHSEAWMRLPSVIAGVATVYLVYLIGKHLGTESIGRMAATFMAIAPYHIYYSQELRPYALSAFWAALVIYALVTNRWKLHTIGLIGGLYTLYLFPFISIVELIWILLAKSKSLKPWFLSSLVAALAFLPWLPYLWEQLQSGRLLPQLLPNWVQLSSLAPIKALPLTYAKFALGRITFTPKIYYGFAILATIPFFLIPILKTFLPAKQSFSSKLIPQAWLFIPFSLALLVSIWIPLNGPWRLLFSLPAMYLLIALGIQTFTSATIKKTLTVGVLLCSLFGTFTYQLNPTFHREDWQSATRFLRFKTLAASTPIGIVNAFPEPFAPLNWYASDLPIVGILDNLTADPQSVDQNLTKYTVTKDTIYYFDYLQDLTDPQRHILNWLTDHGYQETNTYDFRGIGFIREFRRRPQAEYALR